MVGLRADHADLRSITLAALLAASLSGRPSADAARCGLFADQWAFLAGASRIPAATAERVAQEARQLLFRDDGERVDAHAEVVAL
jgi:hypothetical protein